MPKFRVYIEETSSRTWFQEIEAPTKEDAETLAAQVLSDNAEEAGGPSTWFPAWEDEDSDASLSVDEARTEELDVDGREKGDDDGQEYGDPRDARDERE